MSCGKCDSESFLSFWAQGDFQIRRSDYAVKEGMPSFVQQMLPSVALIFIELSSKSFVSSVRPTRRKKALPDVGSVI